MILFQKKTIENQKYGINGVIGQHAVPLVE